MLVLNCFGTYSQVARIGAVHSKPTKFNDYLILERDYPDASYWDVKILEREFDETDSVYVFSDVQTTRMSRSFYKKIDSKYLNDEKYFITVLGYNGDDEIIVEEGPFAICTDCQPGFSCQWGCIGSTYAYSLSLNAVSSGSSMVTMADLTPTNGLYPYYYEWVKEENWSSFIQSQSILYYGVNNFDTGDNNNASKIIVLENVDSEDGIRDASNNLCLGRVIGIRKYIGPWFPSQGNMVSNILIGGEEECGQTFNWAKNTINVNQNNFYNGIPVLNCSGTSFSPSNPSNPVVFPNQTEINYDFIRCIKLYISTFNSAGNLVLTLQSFGDCKKNTISNAFEWPDFIENITFSSLTDTTKPDIHLNKADFFDKDGNYIFPGFILTPGFYYASIQLENGVYFSSFFERQDTTFQNLTKSNFLNYNPYPNPLTSKDYQIDFNATANVEFVYEVKNNLGRTVFTRSYKLDKDETLSDRISLTIPTNYTGFLYNTITFTDGSNLQFTLVK